MAWLWGVIEVASGAIGGKFEAASVNGQRVKESGSSRVPIGF